jgi:hypothetical protein
MGRVCVIGAGSTGIAACQVLHARGIPFDCFEAGSDVGGNWRYDNDSGMSSAYRQRREHRCRQAPAAWRQKSRISLGATGSSVATWVSRMAIVPVDGVTWAVVPVPPTQP